MKKICCTNVKYATKGFSTDLAGKDTRTKITNELMYVYCIICVHMCWCASYTRLYSVVENLKVCTNNNNNKCCYLVHFFSHRMFYVSDTSIPDVKLVLLNCLNCLKHRVWLTTKVDSPIRDSQPHSFFTKRWNNGTGEQTLYINIIRRTLKTLTGIPN